MADLDVKLLGPVTSDHVLVVGGLEPDEFQGFADAVIEHFGENAPVIVFADPASVTLAERSDLDPDTLALIEASEVARIAAPDEP